MSCVRPVIKGSFPDLFLKVFHQLPGLAVEDAHKRVQEYLTECRVQELAVILPY